MAPPSNRPPSAPIPTRAPDDYRVSARAGTHSFVRMALVVLLVAVGGVGLWRFRLSPTQEDLKKYVEVERPKLRPAEEAILQRLEALSPAAAHSSPTAMGPAQARALLVDDVLPRLVRLKAQAAEIRPATDEVRALHAEYQGVIDHLTEASRQCLHALDDEKGDPRQRWHSVQAAFVEVDRAWSAFDSDVQAACQRHHLAKKAL